MGQTGIGVLINLLGGQSGSHKSFAACQNKLISKITLDEGDNSLRFVFADETKLRVFDDGQSCCEHRYMRTDDDLSYHVGATLLGAELKNAPSIPDDNGEHEVQFLEITTSKGVFTLSNHNEHNGYYGGFSISALLET